MSKLHCILVVLVTLTLCLSFAVPAEDDPETPYDESESLSYESSPAISVAEPEAAAPPPVGQPRVVHLPRACPRRTSGQRLGHRTGWAGSICDSLTILHLTLRC